MSNSSDRCAATYGFIDQKCRCVLSVGHEGEHEYSLAEPRPTQAPSKENDIPQVQLTPEQTERSHQLKAAWERPNTQWLVPISLTRYIVHLQDELKRHAHEPLPGTLEARFSALVRMCEHHFGIEPQPLSSEGPETRIHRAMQAASSQPPGDGLKKLAAFGAAVLEESRSEIGDLDGAWLQDKAIECEVIAPVTAMAACGDQCRCAEYDDFPQECLQYTDDVRAALANRWTGLTKISEQP